MVLSSSALRAWRRVHTWTSVVCTVFLLLSCVSGLAMVWLRDLDANFAGHPRPTPAAAGAPLADLDRIFADAQARVPGAKVAYADWAFEGDLVGVNLVGTGPHGAHARRQLVYEGHTGVLLEDLRRDNPHQPMRVFLGFMNTLHITLFAGLAGEFFLAAMATVFVAAVVSGLVLYAPYAEPTRFGAARTGRSRRTLWRDLHNVYGVATAVWMLVVALTGIMNAFTVPAYAAWRKAAVPQLVAAYHGATPIRPLIGPAQATTIAERANPGSRMVRITPPGGRDGSPRHYVVWTEGDRPVTKKLFRPVLVEAQTGAVVLAGPPPWWLSALQLSRPLHFGDYGGWPLKALWSVFDLIAVLVLGSGAWLWVTRLGRSSASAIPRADE